VERCLGSQPRAKVSMMIMRPPQWGPAVGTRARQYARLVVGGGFGRLGLFRAGRQGEQRVAKRHITS
jgi:hypothetical protein